MVKTVGAIIHSYNTEANALGLPSVRADLPMVDQRAPILIAIGKRCLEPGEQDELLRMRKAWSSFLLAEQMQEDLEQQVQFPHPSII